MKQAIYPDHTLENAVRAAGHSCRCLWEMKGPPRTLIAWLVAYDINGRVCIVQTFKDGNGWNVYTACNSIGIDDTVADVLARCGLA